MEIDTWISDQNPQWTDSKYLPQEHNLFRREIFSTVQSWLNKRFILALTGLRRVGKSTIQKQLISDLIKSRKGKQCLYFSFEKIQLKKEPAIIKNIIDWYLHTILLKKIYEVKETVYFFLDEVQNIPHWQEMIKFYYDQNEHFKFIICGSNSLFIKNKSRESLGGRIIEVKISPFSFKEYLRLSVPDYTMFPHSHAWLLANIDLLNSYFEQYLRFGQFPEIISQKLTIEQAKIYLESIEDKVTQQDLPKIFPIEYPELLLAILNQIKSLPGQRIEYQSIAKDLGVDQRTLSKYFAYLEKGFLISICLNVGKKPIKAPRIAKKAYLTSSNLAFEAAISARVENYVFNYLKQRYGRVFFQKDKEVDFIATDNKKQSKAIEVKYQNEIRSEDIKNLQDFIRKKPTTKAFIITKKNLNLKTQIKQIPASLLEFYL